jgi:hypothetical protein
MAEHSNIDANIVIELALNKVIELQKQVILTEAKFIGLRQDYDKLKIEYEVLANKSEEWTGSTTTRKTTTK